MLVNRLIDVVKSQLCDDLTLIPDLREDPFWDHHTSVSDCGVYHHGKYSDTGPASNYYSCVNPYFELKCTRRYGDFVLYTYGGALSTSVNTTLENTQYLRCW